MMSLWRLCSCGDAVIVEKPMFSGCCRCGDSGVVDSGVVEMVTLWVLCRCGRGAVVETVSLWR